MLNVILERVLVKLGDIKRKHEVAPGIAIELAYGQDEKRHKASVTEGTVVSIGPLAYADYKYADGTPYMPIKVGDRVQFAKFAARTVLDPDSPDEELALINDEDVLAVITSKEKNNE